MVNWDELYGDLGMLPEEFQNLAFRKYKLERHHFESLRQIKALLRAEKYTPELASSHLGFLSKLIHKLAEIDRTERLENGIANWHVQNTMRVAKRLHMQLEEIRNSA